VASRARTCQKAKQDAFADLLKSEADCASVFGAIVGHLQTVAKTITLEALDARKQTFALLLPPIWCNKLNSSLATQGLASADKWAQIDDASDTVDSQQKIIQWLGVSDNVQIGFHDHKALLFEANRVLDRFRDKDPLHVYPELQRLLRLKSERAPEEYIERAQEAFDVQERIYFKSYSGDFPFDHILDETVVAYDAGARDSGVPLASKSHSPKRHIARLRYLKSLQVPSIWVRRAVTQPYPL